MQLSYMMMAVIEWLYTDVKADRTIYRPQSDRQYMYFEKIYLWVACENSLVEMFATQV